ncbi:hypothetical protein A9Z41_16305 [Enterobacter cloacae]|nr:hypothetical protein A9Z41_16305 [Enterobacter cloacae]
MTQYPTGARAERNNGNVKLPLIRPLMVKGVYGARQDTRERAHSQLAMKTGQFSSEARRYTCERLSCQCRKFPAKQDRNCEARGR